MAEGVWQSRPATGQAGAVARDLQTAWRCSLKLPLIATRMWTTLLPRNPSRWTGNWTDGGRREDPRGHRGRNLAARTGSRRTGWPGAVSRGRCHGAGAHSGRRAARRAYWHAACAVLQPRRRGHPAVDHRAGWGRTANLKARQAARRLKPIPVGPFLLRKVLASQCPY